MNIGDKVYIKPKWELPKAYLYLSSLVEKLKHQELTIRQINKTTNSCQLEDQYFVGQNSGNIYYYEFPLNIFELAQHRTRRYIVEECDYVRDALLEEIQECNTLTLNPIQFFSTVDKLEQIRVKLDDKLNCLINQQGDKNETVLFDLVKYLVLYRVTKRIQEEN